MLCVLSTLCCVLLTVHVNSVLCTVLCADAMWTVPLPWAVLSAQWMSYDNNNNDHHSADTIKVFCNYHYPQSFLNYNL